MRKRPGETGAFLFRSSILVVPAFAGTTSGGGQRLSPVPEPSALVVSAQPAARALPRRREVGFAARAAGRQVSGSPRPTAATAQGLALPSAVTASARAGCG